MLRLNVLMGMVAVMMTSVTAESQENANGERQVAWEYSERTREGSIRGSEGSEAEGVRGLEMWLEEIDRVREGLQRNDGYLVSSDPALLPLLLDPEEGEGMILQRYMGDLVSAMERVPQRWYEELDAKREALWGEITRLAPRAGMVGRVEGDSAVLAAVTARVKEQVQGATLMRVEYEGEWEPRVTRQGIAAWEYRRGAVLFGIPGGQLVVRQSVTIEQPLRGFPGRGSVIEVRLGHLRFEHVAQEVVMNSNVMVRGE